MRMITRLDTYDIPPPLNPPSGIRSALPDIVIDEIWEFNYQLFSPIALLAAPEKLFVYDLLYLELLGKDGS